MSKIMNSVNRKRLIKDIADIIKNPLSEQGIYYTHDEEEMLVGYALIIGPEDSVYEYGNYFFKFDFPVEYPYQPPKVTFYCCDANTRFHPNLYKNGKVCLSILNTWQGPGWTSCQNIKSVLLTIVSIMDNKPLLHEPGFKETHKDFKNYSNIIEYKNIETAILDIVTKDSLPELFISFYSIIEKEFKKNKNKVLEKLKKLEKSKINNNVIQVKVYGFMESKMNYNKLYELISAI